MKKIFALLLAIVMVMGLATVASATGADPVPTPTVEWSDMEGKTITLNKVYNDDAGTKLELGATNYPDDNADLDFTVVKSDDSLPDLTIDGDVADGLISVTFATDFSGVEVGKYTYTITEKNLFVGDDEVLAITEDTTSIALNVLVYWAEGDTTHADNKIDVALATADGNGKDDTFVNVYELHELTVSKAVTGNLASQEQAFTIAVAFETPDDFIVVSDISYEVNGQTLTIPAAKINSGDAIEIELAHNGSVTFTDIPDGVTCTVVEDADHIDEVAGNENDPATGYSVTYNGEGTYEEIINDDAEVEIVNTKNSEVDTGIVMDSVPFVVMAVIAVLGLAAFTAKKRVQE